MEMLTAMRIQLRQVQERMHLWKIPTKRAGVSPASLNKSGREANALVKEL